MKPGGRPRKVRSKPTSGVGGRTFEASEIVELLLIGEKYSLDLDVEAACVSYIESLWSAYGSYCATEDALSKQVGVADELFDLETLIARAKKVLILVQSGAERDDDVGCLQAASELSESLRSFPNLLAAEIMVMDKAVLFSEKRRTLEAAIIYVRRWEKYRSDFVAYLEFIIETCEQVEAPKGFTKRRRVARDMFGSELGGIYLKQLHPEREAYWKESKRDANDPPPPRSTDEFAKSVMKTLGVKFESKRVSA